MDDNTEDEKAIYTNLTHLHFLYCDFVKMDYKFHEL